MVAWDAWWSAKGGIGMHVHTQMQGGMDQGKHGGGLNHAMNHLAPLCREMVGQKFNAA